MQTETYIETVYQFVVEYLEDLPEEHKAYYRLNGIDPDDNWQLKWSFQTEELAQKQLANEIKQHADFCENYGYEAKTKFRVRDLGATQHIERSVLF